MGGDVPLDGHGGLQQLVCEVGGDSLLTSHPGFSRHHAGDLPVGQPRPLSVAGDDAALDHIKLVRPFAQFAGSEKPVLITGRVMYHHVGVAGYPHGAAGQRHVDSGGGTDPVDLAGDLPALGPLVLDGLSDGYTLGSIAAAGVDVHHDLRGSDSGQA